VVSTLQPHLCIWITQKCHNLWMWLCSKNVKSQKNVLGEGSCDASSMVMKYPPVAIVKGCYGRSICCHVWWHKELMAYVATSFKPKTLSMLVLFSENEKVPSEKQKEGMTYWCNFALFYIYNTQLHTVLVSRARLSPCESLACETNTVYWALYAGWSMGGTAVTW